MAMKASAILAFHSTTHNAIDAFLQQSPVTLVTPSSTRPPSDVSFLNSHKKAFRHSSSSSLLQAHADDEDDVEGYEISSGSSSSNNKTQQTSTSFGSENVPDAFRPSNEYLNLINQPLFGWASQDNGDNGLVIRLAVTYAAFFVFV
jgi:hypothetical protein